MDSRRMSELKAILTGIGVNAGDNQDIIDKKHALTIKILDDLDRIVDEK